MQYGLGVWLVKMKLVLNFQIDSILTHWSVNEKRNSESLPLLNYTQWQTYEFNLSEVKLHKCNDLPRTDASKFPCVNN